MTKPKHRRIATSTTTTFYTTSIVLRQIAIVCSDAGTTWTFSMTDKATPDPAHIIAPITISKDAEVMTKVSDFKEGIPCEGGLDVVTSGGSPGVVDVWVWIEQPATS